MKSLLVPKTTQNNKLTFFGVLLLLIFSATSVFVAPVFMPDSYSWLSNAISESAAQGVQGAWIARFGFLSFGLAVLWLSISLRAIWARGAYWMHLAFGIFMVSTAAFSHRPWLDNVPFDSFEDVLHSFTATGMGFAFSFGVLARLLQRGMNDKPKRIFDVIALLTATFIPLLMNYWSSMGGIAQRLLFLVAYLWYGNESLLICQLSRKTPNHSSAPN